MCQHKDFSGSQGLNFGLLIIERKNRLDRSVKVSEIIISSDVYVHIHRENATCRTRVCLKGNRNSFPWQQEVCKSFLLITVLIKYIDFVVNFIIVMLSILFYSQYKQFWGWFWLFWIWSSVPPVFLFVSVYTPLSLESDFWPYIFCRLLPRRSRVSCLKSYELPFCLAIIIINPLLTKLVRSTCLYN